VIQRQSTELLQHPVYLLGTRCVRVEYGFCIVEDYEHVLEGQERSQGGQVLGISDACTNGLGELAEGVGERGRELVATNGPTLVAELSFDAIVAKDGWSGGRLANPPGTNQSDWREPFCGSGQTLGFALAKGLIRGLTRCPNPSSRF